jgi:ribonuclease HI
MDIVIMYTDGSYKRQHNVGGWAAHIEKADGNIHILSGGALDTTNNRMELIAVIEGLSSLKDPSRVVVYSDSQYVVKAIQYKWIDIWKNRNWITSGWKGNKPQDVKNRDLWEKLYELLQIHIVQAVWVKGHSDCEKNNLVDELAQSEADKMKKVS